MKVKLVCISLLAIVGLASCVMPTAMDDDITETGIVRSVGNAPVNQYVLNTTDGTQYAISATYAKYAGCVLRVTGCVDGDTLYGMFFDIHYVDILDR